MKKWVWITVSWFGVSFFFKFLRGTWGTLAALPFAWAIQTTLGNTALFIASACVFVLGVIASNEYVKITGKEDPNEIVIDEVAAIFALLACMYPTAGSYIIAFLLFRLFDIFKPWPVSVADRRVKGGFGVMFDDMLAAFYPVAIYIIISIMKPEWAVGIDTWLKTEPRLWRPN